MLSPRRSFSRIFIERAALEYPDTAAVCARFPDAERVTIDHYSEIMNRPHQAWRIQKRSQALVLAVRHDAFLYPMPAIVQSVGSTPAFYNTPLLNCLYDCTYCYLQGMYGSANIVTFVNTEDFFDATSDKLAALGSLYLSLSYDTDLLGFEGILPLTRRWIEFASDKPGLTLEIRTKSARFSALAGLAPNPNVILAWTVSPEPIVTRFEHRTASLEARLRNINAAITAGWSVRLAFDPVIWSPDWAAHYGALIEQVTAAIPIEKLRDTTVGVFRMNGEFFKGLKRARPEAAFEYGALAVDSAGVATYPPEREAELREFIVQRLRATGALVHA